MSGPRWPRALANAGAFAPLVMFALDVPAIMLGIDRMNEIDRLTPVTLWASLGCGLIAAGSASWLGASGHPCLPRKRWVVILIWGPLSAFFVGWSISGMASIVPGETGVAQATAQSFDGGGRTLCRRRIFVVRQGNIDSDMLCLATGWGKRVGPDDLAVGENLALTIHASALGSTVESIERAEPP